jgi:hypothetical protein
MTDEAKQEAAEHAKQAAGQGKAAAKEAGRAAKAAAEPVVEAVGDNVHKLEGTARDAAEAVKNSRALRETIINASAGTIALSASVLCGTLAFSIFYDMAKGRKS